MALAHHPFSFVITRETISVLKERRLFFMLRFTIAAHLLSGYWVTWPPLLDEQCFRDGDGNTSSLSEFAGSMRHHCIFTEICFSVSLSHVYTTNFALVVIRSGFLQGYSAKGQVPEIQ